MNLFIKILSSKIFNFLRKLILHFILKISGYKNFGSFYETGEEQVFEIIKKNKIKYCMDIGAHVGEFSKKLLKLKDVNVIAFEPMKKIFDELKKIENENYKKFKCFNIALSDQRGWKDIFYIDQFSQLSSISVNPKKDKFLKKEKN